MPDYARYARAMDSQRGYRRAWAYEAYLQDCEDEGLRPYARGTFYMELSKFRRERILDASPEWLPGEYARTFWSDATVRVADEEICVRLFACQLAASDKTFVCRAEGRGVQSWMRCCERAFRSFGGAPHVVDCTMAAAVNGEAGSATLSAFATHYKTVLFGARPKTAKTAASAVKPQDVRNSSAVLKCVRKAIRGNAFTAEDELDAAVARSSAAANAERGVGGISRDDVFSEYEAAQLLELPSEPYAFEQWGVRSVGNDYHFLCMGTRFSVPWRYANTQVRVRFDETRVRAYSGGELIADHEVPVPKSNMAVTDPSHRPTGHRVFAARMDERFLRLAEPYGKPVCRAMQRLLRDCRREGTGYIRCKQLIDLAREPHPIELSAACKLVLDEGALLTVERVSEAMDGGAS